LIVEKLSFLSEHLECKDKVDSVENQQEDIVDRGDKMGQSLPDEPSAEHIRKKGTFKKLEDEKSQKIEKIGNKNHIFQAFIAPGRLQLIGIDYGEEEEKGKK